MSLLILMRHGQSMWNAANLFTGWVDVPLTQKGIDEALEGGRKISHLPIDEVHTSALIRAQMTAMLALSQHQSKQTPIFQYEASSESLSSNEGKMAAWAQMNSEADPSQVLPVFASWKLNERMYGDLQGLNKQETREKFGDEQVKIWRRSYDVPPPSGESLELTAKRTLPYFAESILPSLEDGKNVFVAAHGNSLRSIIMDLEGLSREQVLSLEVPTGVPIVYQKQEQEWTRLQEF
ncbi:MAG: 2,3-bisphosphoglycerate-dependent phosphoglycerate mutase [Candidatus Poseidoniaceae archaeon]|nr:2,3-bisphosphoglycerate-dependent phosphoglycerate mutase [Candidatus Poseidoniaceae archaeon]